MDGEMGVLFSVSVVKPGSRNMGLQALRSRVWRNGS